MDKSSKGFYGWRVLAVLALLIFLVGGITIFSFSVLLKPLMEEFGVGRGEISLNQSIFFLAAGISGMLAGRFSHRFSPKRFILIGFFSGGILLLIAYLANSIWYLYAIYLLLGAGYGGLSGPVPVAMITSKWFIKKRGMAFGLSMVGGALGSVVIIPLIGIINDQLGWRFAYLIMGFFTLAAIPLIIKVVKDSPEEMGLLPDGGTIPEENNRTPEPTSVPGFRKYMGNPSLWLLVFGFILITMSEMSIVTHEVPYLTDINISPVMAASALGFTGGFGLFGRLLSGWLSDKVSSRYVIVLFVLLKLLGIFVLTRVTNIGTVWLFVVIFGFSTGLVALIMPITIGDIFGQTALGVVLGFMNLIICIGCVLGPSMAGYIFDVTGSYSMLFSIVMIMCIASLPMIYMAYGISPNPVKSPARQ